MLSALLVVLTLGMAAPAANYKIDPAHTRVEFTAPHLMVSKVKGHFEKFDGSFIYDETSGKLENVSVTIETNSLTTSEADRDKHLHSPDFFDVTKFPTITFKSTKIENKDKKPAKVEGDLTIRGVTKKVVLDVKENGLIKDPWGNQVLSFEAKTKVDRKDYGLNWNKSLDKGGVVVGDNIIIDITGEAKQVTAGKK